MKRTIWNKLYSAWDIFWIKLDFFRSTLSSRCSLWFQGCPIGRNFKTSGICYFKARKSGSIHVGDNVTLLAGHRSNRVGLTNPVLLETMGDGHIEIGSCSGGSGVVISSRSGVTIGNNVKMGGNVRIFDHDYHALDAAIRRTDADSQHIISKPVVIENDVFIGTNALILKGVTIGSGAIIAAGAVVVGAVPSGEIWGGNPARFLKKLS